MGFVFPRISSNTSNMIKIITYNPLLYSLRLTSSQQLDEGEENVFLFYFSKYTNKRHETERLTLSEESPLSDR